MKLRTETTFPHLFSVKVLDKLPGLFKPRRYIYHCARCKWTFVLNDGRRGALRPVADGIKPLTREEAVARAATFAAGPCPAMGVLADAHLRLHGNGSNGHGPALAEHAPRSEQRLNQLSR